MKSTQQDPILSTNLEALETPGVIIQVDPDTATSLGAFEETALSEVDAWESNADVEAMENE